MSIAYPIFPGLAPSQSFTSPSLPVRSPTWSWKESFEWSNFKQRAVNGRALVVKYWTNPIHHWEWKYGYIKDNPGDSNPFYSVPVPATDFEILKGFYNGMAAGGNEFAYQPPDSQRGVDALALSVNAPINGQVILGVSSTAGIRLGDIWVCSDFSVSTWLNGAVGTVVAIDFPNALVTLVTTTPLGVHAFTTDTGAVVGGQPLAAADANNNIELVNTLGSYPTTITGFSPTMTRATESVQLIDTSTLRAYDGTGATLSYTLNNPDSVAPYQGYVLHFASAPATPVTAFFNQYFLCRFSEDTQEFENWLTTLWLCSSLKFEQYRI